jgi:PHD/YefM family antitoxin component YafN of YafNO toxin-antitoxin module
MAAVEEALVEGPVHVIREDRPQYVILREEDYRALLDDLATARLKTPKWTPLRGG